MKNITEKYLTILNEEKPEELPVGKHNDISNDKFDSKQLEMGIKIEMEHTDDKNIALAIAKDHLSECKIYYTLLEEMEAKCKGK